MGSKERRERERAERRELILSTAATIINEDGADGLSMRKIASRIEYSPALIYHYFRNKEEILDALMERGFQKIVGGLQGAALSTDQPERQFREFIKTYINNALTNPEQYKTVLLNGSPAILKYTALLFEGASQKPSVNLVRSFLQKTYFSGISDDLYIELTVQVIWTAMFGLVIRMLIEEIPQEQQQRLINHHIEMMLGAVNWMVQKADHQEE